MMTDLDTIHTLTETLHISATLNKFEKKPKYRTRFISIRKPTTMQTFFITHILYTDVIFSRNFFSNSRVPMDSYSVDTSVALAPIRIDSDVNKTC